MLILQGLTQMATKIVLDPSHTVQGSVFMFVITHPTGQVGQKSTAQSQFLLVPIQIVLFISGY